MQLTCRLSQDASRRNSTAPTCATVPNPLYKPISYTYPMERRRDDPCGFISRTAALATANRFVQTPSLASRAPRRASDLRQLREARTDRSKAAAHPGDPPGPFKNGAFINIIQHGGHLLALNESTTGFEITRDLDTIGEWKAGTDKPLRLGAHNRRHPKTGALFAIDYSHAQPTVQIHQIDASGNLVNSFPVALAAPTMIHDFVLTERYIVLLVCPAVFDSAAAQQGQSFLQWRPSMGTRIGLIALDGSTTPMARRGSFLRLPLRKRLRAWRQHLHRLRAARKPRARLCPADAEIADPCTG